jgi:hypothetical protein
VPVAIGQPVAHRATTGADEERVSGGPHRSGSCNALCGESVSRSGLSGRKVVADPSFDCSDFNPKKTVDILEKYFAAAAQYVGSWLSGGVHCVRGAFSATIPGSKRQ